MRTSDVDLVVISPDFASMPFLRRIREVVALWESDLDLEVLLYTPEEFERKKEEIGIVAVAAREGVEIEL
ncbi:TPA: nucleotidyltransferase [Candidatus Acetothermia bacterium]|nr:nucleotidyltransferase [Candidatus Acetothermia bacterium]